MVYISRISCSFGDWEIRASERGVTAVTNRVTFAAAKENAITRKAAEELLQYFAGAGTAFSVPLELEGTSFQRSVWDVLSKILYGTRVCYSDVARAIGRPSAVRAVAGAIGKNPCLVLIPCHRVLGKDGSLTGFSAGLELKERLLALEGIAYR